MEGRRRWDNTLLRNTRLRGPSIKNNKRKFPIAVWAVDDYFLMPNVT